jgi:hypothetical protein
VHDDFANHRGLWLLVPDNAAFKLATLDSFLNQHLFIESKRLCKRPGGGMAISVHFVGKNALLAAAPGRPRGAEHSSSSAAADLRAAGNAHFRRDRLGAGHK